MTQPLSPAEFDVSLARDSQVEARWTSTGHRYVAPATVFKVNAKSVLVKLDADVFGSGTVEQMDQESIAYPANHVITLPRYASSGYSANNGAYPVPTKEVAVEEMLPPEVLAAMDEYASEIAEEARQQDALEADTLYPEPLREHEAEFAIQREAPVAEWEIAPVPVSAWWGSGSPANTAQSTEAPVPLVMTLADASGPLGDEPLVEEPRVWLYTNAPEDLDLAETLCLEIVGTLHGKADTSREAAIPYRKVRLPAHQEQAQASAYGSDGWNAHTPREWAELLGEAWFCDRFVPRGCEEVTPDEGLSLLRQDYPRWLAQHATAHGDPAPRFDRDDMAWLAQLDAMLTPEAGAAPSEAVAKVLALAAQGAEAVAKALARGELRWGREENKKEKPAMVRIHIPRRSEGIPADILAIREAVANGESRKSVAKRFGRSISNVGKIINGEYYKDLATSQR